MIYCLGGIQIEVAKTLQILSGTGMAAVVKTRYFRYNAWIKNGNNILRYEPAIGHRKLPHKHTFDTFGDGRETALFEYSKSAEIPTLGVVIAEHLA
jgi:hypothetical protein